MDIFSATAAVLRRWYVALPILLVTAWFAVQQYQSVEPTYTTTASSVLLPPPPQAPTPLIIDPEDLETPLDPAISSLGNGTELIRALVEQNLENDLVRQRLQGLGATATYEVDAEGDRPIVDYVVIGDDPEVTARTLEALMAEATNVLTQVQQTIGATTPAVYRLQTAAPILPPVEVAPERNRALIATIVGGGALAYFLALLVDAGINARRTHRERTALVSAGQSGAGRRRVDGDEGAARPPAQTKTYVKRSPGQDEGGRQGGRVTSSATTRD